MKMKPDDAATEEVSTWFKRIHASEGVQTVWEEACRVDDCYAYWKGYQRAEMFDVQKERKAQVNLVHPQVRTLLPSLYFYRPFGRVTAEPERADTQGSVLEERKQLLQDIGNYFARDKETHFRDSTFLALKEHFWAFGCVEVGYDPQFKDNPTAPRPPLKEAEDTKGVDTTGDTGGDTGGDKAIPTADIPAAPAAPDIPASPVLSLASQADQLTAQAKHLREALSGESFYVKFISARQILVSASDRPIVEENDWIGYWEDYNLEDVKRAPAYKNTKNLKPSTGKKGKDSSSSEEEDKLKSDPDAAEAKKIRLYKIWDLRTKKKIVLAADHKLPLMKRAFKRLPLKFLRPDLDPYHFRPIPPIYNGLGEQDAHNDSWEYLRKIQKQTKARWTYDAQAVKREDIEQFERDDVNYIPRDAGTTRPIEPVEHPQFTQLPLQMLGLSERAFAQTSGTSPEARQAQVTGEKTATQAVIQNNAMQVVGSFDRALVAEWLAEIIEELIQLAVDHLTLSRWIAINVDRESPMALLAAAEVAQRYREIKADELETAASGIRWHVTVDVESISPVAEQEQLNRLLQMLNFIGNEKQAILLSQAPMLLDRLLDLSGLRGGRDRDVIRQALAAVVQLSAATAAAGAGTPGGIAPMPGVPSPSPQVPGPPTTQAGPIQPPPGMTLATGG